MDKPKLTRSNQTHTPTVETLGPIAKNKKPRLKSRSLIFLLALLMALSLAAGGYLLKTADDQNKDLSSPTPPRQNLTSSEANLGENAVEASSLTEQLVQDQDQQKPIVVFEPEGEFTKEEKQELNEKMVKPMSDYRPDVFVAIHIETYSPYKFVSGADDDKYIVTTVGHENSGGSGSFLFGSKKKGLDYWTPDCLGSCHFSDEYRQEYPQVVEKYRP